MDDGVGPVPVLVRERASERASTHELAKPGEAVPRPPSPCRHSTPAIRVAIRVAVRDPLSESLPERREAGGAHDGRGGLRLPRGAGASRSLFRPLPLALSGFFSPSLSTSPASRPCLHSLPTLSQLTPPSFRLILHLCTTVRPSLHLMLRVLCFFNCSSVNSSQKPRATQVNTRVHRPACAHAHTHASSRPARQARRRERPNARTPASVLACWRARACGREGVRAGRRACVRHGACVRACVRAGERIERAYVGAYVHACPNTPVLPPARTATCSWSVRACVLGALACARARSCGRDVRGRTAV